MEDRIPCRGNSRLVRDPEARKFELQKHPFWVGEMVQSVKSTSVKSWAWQHECNTRSGEVEIGRSPGVHWQARLAEPWTPGSVRDSVSENQVEKQLRKIPSMYFIC